MDIRIVLKSGLVPSPAEVSEIRDMGKMRLAGQGIRSPRRTRCAVRLINEMSGGVAVALNPPAMVPENVDINMTPLLVMLAVFF